ncbi:MAG: ABC transporter ATP-binding protein [Actinobacteria bacterium]|nr:ABC transporter ATP-binding protein [Actinomycetota bacterium]
MIHLYYEALRGFRRRTGFAVILFTLSGLFESFGIAALLPFLQGSLKGEGNKEYFGLRGDDLAFAALVAVIVLGVLAAVLRYVADLRLYRLQADLEASLRDRMANALLQMRWTSFLRMSFGEAAKAVITDGQGVGLGTAGLVNGLGFAAIAFVFVVVAATISLEMTGATLVFGAVIAGVYKVSGRKAEQRGRLLVDQATRVTDVTEGMFNNFKFHRSTGVRNAVLSDANKVYRDWADDFVRVCRFQPATRMAFDIAGLAFIAATLAISVLVLDNSATEAFVFLALFYRLAPKLQQAQQGLLVAKAHGAWWSAWNERYLHAVAEIDDRRGAAALEQVPKIELNDVSFSYPGREVTAIEQVSWTLEAGACLALVGESGSGKTTVLDLVTGLLEPAGGTIQLDGIDQHALDIDAWQRSIGVVIQDSPVFFGTVLENVAWGAEPDRARAQRCLEQANAAAVVAALPEGLDTHVGLHGSRLSGGQRQRLALARALYREPLLLVLDEATSALDAASEQAIQSALSRLKGTCSIILVAHRLKTVEMADTIVVLAGGRVVEAGTWTELERAGGTFRRMLTAQGNEPRTADA